jgi:predicted DNA-binding protein with PD1-like motif
LSLLGNIATGDDGKPTLEVTIVETPTHLRRRKPPELGIALIDPG